MWKLLAVLFLSWELLRPKKFIPSLLSVRLRPTSRFPVLTARYIS